MLSRRCMEEGKKINVKTPNTVKQVKSDPQWSPLLLLFEKWTKHSEGCAKTCEERKKRKEINKIIITIDGFQWSKSVSNLWHWTTYSCQYWEWFPFFISLIKIQRKALKGNDSLPASAIQFAVLSWLRQKQLSSDNYGLQRRGRRPGGRGWEKWIGSRQRLIRWSSDSESVYPPVVSSPWQHCKY